MSDSDSNRVEGSPSLPALLPMTSRSVSSTPTSPRGLAAIELAPIWIGTQLEHRGSSTKISGSACGMSFCFSVVRVKTGLGPPDGLLPRLMALRDQLG